MEKVMEAETFLIERENKLSNTQCSQKSLASEKIPDPFARGNHLYKIILISHCFVIQTILNFF